jgi:hypothetical protein
MDEGMCAMIDDRQQAGKKSSEAIRAEVKSFMEKPSPRVVTKEMYRLARNPLGGFFVFMGGLVIAEMVFMTILFAMLDKIGKPIAFSIFMGSSLAIGIGMIGWGRYIRQEILNVLSMGRQTKGRVLKVKSLGSRINERTFYRVWAEWIDQNGVWIMGKDTIDNFSLDFFLEARDSRQEIDVIYAPGIKKVILPMKLAFGGRLD